MMLTQLKRRVVLTAAAALGVAALLSTRPALAADDAALAQGRQLFLKGATPACALCHTLQDAGAEGAVGPVLDELRPDAARVLTALRNGIGQMPSYRATLSDAQMQALAQYVARATGAGK